MEKRLVMARYTIERQEEEGRQQKINKIKIKNKTTWMNGILGEMDLQKRIGELEQSGNIR